MKYILYNIISPTLMTMLMMWWWWMPLPYVCIFLPAEHKQYHTRCFSHHIICILSCLCMI